MTACKIDGCPNGGRITRGWCNSHYLRNQRHGDPMGGKGAVYSNPAEAFAARTRSDGDCIVWTGSLDGAGYGQLRIGDRLTKAHRYAWEAAHGPIPEGLYVDHTCWNKACVAVPHLRLATHGENVQYQARARKDNQSGYRGVSKKRNTWVARATKDGVTHTKHGFSTAEDAAEAATKMRADLFGAYAGKG